MSHKTTFETVSFQCPRLQGVATLRFEYRTFYCDESPDPVTGPELMRFNCSGVCACGISPQLSPTSWGIADWNLCAYPNLVGKGVQITTNRG